VIPVNRVSFIFSYCPSIFVGMKVFFSFRFPKNQVLEGPDLSPVPRRHIFFSSESDLYRFPSSPVFPFFHPPCACPVLLRRFNYSIPDLTQLRFHSFFFESVPVYYFLAPHFFYSLISGHRVSSSISLDEVCVGFDVFSPTPRVAESAAFLIECVFRKWYSATPLFCWVYGPRPGVGLPLLILPPQI